MSPDLTAFITAGAAAGAVGVAGAFATLRLANKSTAAASISGPVVVVAALSAGVGASASHMWLTAAQWQLLLVILVTTSVIGVVVGLVTATSVRRIEARAVAAETSHIQETERERSRKEMVTWVSHDLRTPLAGIRALTEALQDGVAPDPVEYHQRIMTEVDRTTGMVEDLLALTSMHSGQVRLTTEDVHLDDLVSDALATIRPLAQERAVTVRGEADGVVIARGDTRLLFRAVMNLMRNAVQNSPAGGEVTVCARQHADMVCIAVADSCGGIDEEVMTQLFEPGWRGSAARTPQRGTGAGLGLSVVEAIMTAHGGSVTVENAAGGCQFTLHLAAA